MISWPLANLDAYNSTAKVCSAHARCAASQDRAYNYQNLFCRSSGGCGRIGDDLVDGGDRNEIYVTRNRRR